MKALVPVPPQVFVLVELVGHTCDFTGAVWLG